MIPKKDSRDPIGVCTHSPVGNQNYATGFRLYRAGNLLQSVRTLSRLKNNTSKLTYKTALDWSWLTDSCYPNGYRVS